LRWAAMLHEVGLNINHSGLHRHSAYILQHSDLPGFNQEQQMMMATLVRYHRKAIKLDDMPRFTLFKEKTVSAVNSATSSGRITEQPAAGDHYAADAATNDR
ncbi:exopolyphosphatase, partial [Salmonella enterica subsp. enterica serovar Heidelberg str. RI-11-014316]